MSLEKVNPVVNDGVEFYVSGDGQETGMSISGLARFIGINLKTLQELIEKLEVTGKPLPETLKPFVGEIFSSRVEGINGAKIIKV